jgi:hypothetical protein
MVDEFYRVDHRLLDRSEVRGEIGLGKFKRALQRRVILHAGESAQRFLARAASVLAKIRPSFIARKNAMAILR